MHTDTSLQPPVNTYVATKRNFLKTVTTLLYYYITLYYVPFIAIPSAPWFPFSLRQSYKLPEELHEELLSTVSRRDDVQAVSTLICKGAPIELLDGLSVLRLAVTTDRINTVSLLLASGAPLPASLLQEAWQSPDVTHRVLATLTTAYCCRLRAEQRRLEKVSSALVEGIDNLVTTIEGNTPWQAAWRWGKETDRPALSDLLAKAAAANCPVTAAFLHMAGGWTVFNGASGGTALHAALEAGHKGMAELLIRDLGGCPCVPDTHGRLAVHMMPHEEQQRLEQVRLLVCVLFYIRT
ncbi:uncharacterized protein LOC135106766 [Scylla paramamosain]|uniref:uncharacterized protein LOC135106766 n=1 Tax=Scylla paramamosain TaxID=85552 RepID=UPI0030831EE8